MWHISLTGMGYDHTGTKADAACKYMAVRSTNTVHIPTSTKRFFRDPIEGSLSPKFPYFLVACRRREFHAAVDGL